MRYQNLSEQLMNEIGQQIVGGDLSTGEALPPVELLSKQKGVSRTVTREAYKGLEARKLIGSQPKVGTIVRAPLEWQWWDIDVLRWALNGKPNRRVLKELMEVRLAIEPAAVQLAATNATAEDIRVIKQRYDELERSVGNVAQWVDADYEFHQCILLASHNHLMLTLVQTLRSALEYSRRRTMPVLKNKENSSDEVPMQVALLKHRAVMDAIVYRDGELARSKMLDVLAMVSNLLDDADDDLFFDTSAD